MSNVTCRIKDKGELLKEIMSLLEILPECECQRIWDYLSELFCS